jgi:DNA-binding transcriptional ArsR family regulator
MKLDCCENEKTKGELNEVVDFLRTISEKNRLKILCILQKKELCVCEIWEDLGLSQNLASHHLKVLKDFGLVESRKEGTKVIYSLNSENTSKHLSALSHFI